MNRPVSSGMPSNPPLRVLFDGGCPLCRREIAHYQRLRPRRELIWVDIDANREAAAALGVTQQAAMARFHVLEGSAIHTGARAFVLLWSALPAWRHLATLVRGLRLVGPMEVAYRWFARRRLRQRCADGHCSVP